MVAGYTDWMALYELYRDNATMKTDTADIKSSNSSIDSSSTTTSSNTTTIKQVDTETLTDFIEFSGTLDQLNSIVNATGGLKMILKMIQDTDTSALNHVGIIRVVGSAEPMTTEMVTYGAGGADIRSPSTGGTITNDANIRIHYKSLGLTYLTNAMLSRVLTTGNETGTLADTVDDDNSTFYRVNGNGSASSGSSVITITYAFVAGDILWIRRKLNIAGNSSIAFTVKNAAGTTLFSETMTTATGVKSEGCVAVMIPETNATLTVTISWVDNVINNIGTIYEMDVIKKTDQV